MTDSTSDQRTDRPGRSPSEVLGILQGELSRRDRLRYVGVLLAGLAVASVVGSLWATEPSLPLRTHLAFGGIVALALGWVGVAGYVLSRRRPLYATDRVLASGMGMAATFVVGLAAVVISALRAGQGAGATAAMAAATLFAASAALHLRARAQRRALLARRRELERSG